MKSSSEILHFVMMIAAVCAAAMFVACEQGTDPPAQKTAYTWTYDTLSDPAVYSVRVLWGSDIANLYLLTSDMMMRFDGRRFQSVRLSNVPGRGYCPGSAYWDLDGDGVEVWAVGSSVRSQQQNLPDSSFMLHYDGSRMDRRQHRVCRVLGCKVPGYRDGHREMTRRIAGGAPCTSDPRDGACSRV